jgi:hypothetical protein
VKSVLTVAWRTIRWHNGGCLARNSLGSWTANVRLGGKWVGDRTSLDNECLGIAKLLVNARLFSSDVLL